MLKKHIPEGFFQNPDVQLRVSALSVLDLLIANKGLGQRFNNLHDAEGHWKVYTNTKHGALATNYQPSTGPITLTLEREIGSKPDPRSDADIAKQMQDMLTAVGIVSETDSEIKARTTGKVCDVKEIIIDPKQPEFADKIARLYEAHRHDTMVEGKPVAGLDTMLRDEMIGRVRNRVESAVNRLPKGADGKPLDPDQARSLLSGIISAVNEVAKENGINLTTARVRGAA